MKLSAVAVVVGVGLVGAFVAMKTPAAPVPNVVEATSFKVDTVHSSVVFKIRHNGVSNFYGRFNDFGGEFTFDPEDLSAANFDISVKATSIDTGNDNRDGHLRTAEFFNVGDFGTISFKSTSVSNADGKGMYSLAGDLTMLGTSKPITAKLEWIGTKDGGERMGFLGGFEATFTIKRSDFGMNYGIERGALGDEVTLFVAIEGRKQ